MDLGDNSGTQGNPFLYAPDSEVRSIWMDDEYDFDEDTHQLSVYVLESGDFPSSGNWTRVLLPSHVNQEGKEAIQPTFTGRELFFTQDINVVSSAYSGTHDATGYADDSNWAVPDMILKKDTSFNGLQVTEEEVGKIIAIGEPTLAKNNGEEILYFVYAYIRGIDPITGFADLDFQAGFVPKKPTRRPSAIYLSTLSPTLQNSD